MKKAPKLPSYRSISKRLRERREEERARREVERRESDLLGRETVDYAVEQSQSVNAVDESQEEIMPVNNSSTLAAKKPRLELPTETPFDIKELQSRMSFGPPLPDDDYPQ